MQERDCRVLAPSGAPGGQEPSLIHLVSPTTAVRFFKPGGASYVCGELAVLSLHLRSDLLAAPWCARTRLSLKSSFLLQPLWHPQPGKATLASAGHSDFQPSASLLPSLRDCGSDRRDAEDSSVRALRERRCILMTQGSIGLSSFTEGSLSTSLQIRSQQNPYLFSQAPAGE